MTDLTPLIDRVRSGEGPDVELDVLILCAIAAPAGSFVEQSKINGVWCIWEKPGRLWERRAPWYRSDGWPLTSSLDAVVALIGEKLPGWGGKVHFGFRDQSAAALFHADDMAWFDTADTPARALLAATLSALQAQGEKP